MQRVNKTEMQKEHTNVLWHDSDGTASSNNQQPYQINAVENFEMNVYATRYTENARLLARMGYNNRILVALASKSTTNKRITLN